MCFDTNSMQTFLLHLLAIYIPANRWSLVTKKTVEELTVDSWHEQLNQQTAASDAPWLLLVVRKHRSLSRLSVDATSTVTRKTQLLPKWRPNCNVVYSRGVRSELNVRSYELSVNSQVWTEIKDPSSLSLESERVSNLNCQYIWVKVTDGTLSHRYFPISVRDVGLLFLSM